ncbi:aspartyl/glutamyl-tRNA amidotransferase subunit C [Williamsoniiplasma somnilux]|uniref:Aspartyl/glutamyl-tRNA amidotransferase subunit C n=1 Tax=Williamsoniiplasma somnilux TaxID=215578 RepID=A0A2K8NZM2_9MOLU|nr:Asp-tRNA(Asn)/Glu-tRNA(Gln) amidotransferase subunit GatC [Williamsoniiplasma somnilux]ATZ18996.1 aspartyl/glutamyl-tRNA amidotransferase subunit C [Williamsoniiplasma somnilux]
MNDINNINDELIKELASDIMLELSQGEINEIIEAEESIIKRFKQVTSINTDNIEPLNYPFENSHVFLREDEDFYTNSQEDLLNNAPTVDGDFITIVKVIK